MRPPGTALLVLLLALPPALLAAQATPGGQPELAAALSRGGLVIVMRHANSPRETPDAVTANPDNTARERQLDATGRRDAASMGEALRRLRIPVEEVLSSPTYRALETAKLLGVPAPRVEDSLGNEGMQATGASKAAWLQAQVARATRGGNRILITHGPNMSAAFPEAAAGMGEGDALVFEPRAEVPARLLGRIAIGDWAGL